jgi:hypothetical protein
MEVREECSVKSASSCEGIQEISSSYVESEHAKIYDKYGALESARQKLREEQIDKKTTTDLVVRKMSEHTLTDDAPGFEASSRR